MRLVILTTETPHHCHFVRELSDRFPVEAVLVERGAVQPKFDVHHPFEDLRDAYERRVWFGGRAACLADLAEVSEHGSLNDDDAVRRLVSLRPQVAIVFGTGKLGSRVRAACPKALLNLHGGDPERHRGLDTHLWAIYEDRFDALVTTLHRVNAELDDGAIVRRVPIRLHRNLALHELRRVNTEVCLDLVVATLESYDRDGRIRACRQQSRGRYYSFMPAALKAACRTKFERYTRSLP